MGRESLMKKQKLEREARKKGHKTREAINKYVKNKPDKSGTTWTDSKGKIIQADEGRNKGRKWKEEVGQDIGKVRGRQKARENISEGNVKGLANQAGGTFNKGVNWLKNNLKIKTTDLSKPRKKTKVTFNSSGRGRKKK